METKVWAAGAGAGAGGVLGTAADWALGVFVWHASDKATDTAAALAAVPLPIAALVGLGITVLGAAIAGYQAPASNNAGNNAAGAVMDDSTAGSDHAPALPPVSDEGAPSTVTLPDDVPPAS